MGVHNPVACREGCMVETQRKNPSALAKVQCWLRSRPFPVLAVVSLVWDSATPHRFAIVMLIIAVVCFSLAIFFFLRRR